MPHHSLLTEIENDIERLVLSSQSQQQNNLNPQQPTGYGQSIYGTGGMPVGAGMPYQQPVYGMQSQMMRPGYGQQAMPYGPGYVDSGDGRPAMIFGGPSEGLVGPGMPLGSQQRYYQPGSFQGYPAAGQPGYPQAYPPNSQPMYPQGGYLSAQSPYPQGYQPSQSLYSQGYQPPYQPGPQPGNPGYSPQPQPQPSPQQGYVQPQPIPQSSYPQGSQIGPRPGTQTPPPPPVYTPQPSLPPQPAYPSTSQSGLPPTYLTNPQDPQAPQKSYLTTSQSSYPSSQQPGPQMRMPSPGLPISRASSPVPPYLNPQDTMVRFEPVSSKTDTHHHALKSLTSSSQSPEALTAILGSYLAAKQAHESNHTFSSTYPHARPEVQAYNHSMDKLESLSVDFLAKHKVAPAAWLAAIGPHRRHIFATLYNENELVRGFCSEVSGGPMMLPELDAYGLGKTMTSFNFSRATVRSSNLNASMSTLSQVQTVVLIDDSGSMTEPGHQSWGFGGGGGYPETRWNQARTLLAGIAPLVSNYSPHGIDLHFLNRKPFYSGLRTSAAVEAAFDGDSPNNGTPTGQRVNDILDSYMCTLRHFRTIKPLNLIVITDGEAQDENILHWTIEHHVTKIVHRGFPAHQFGIEFIQVGDCSYATRHLEKLEEEVSRHHHRFQRDVVGITPATRITRMDPEKLLGIVVSGIDARMNSYMRARGVNV